MSQKPLAPLQFPPEAEAKIHQFIKDTSGAPAAFMVFHSDTVPCQMVKSGIECVGAHAYHWSTYGMDRRYVFGMLLTLMVDEGTRGGFDVKEELEAYLEHMDPENK